MKVPAFVAGIFAFVRSCLCGTSWLRWGPMELGKTGVWWSGSWKVEADPEVEVAAALESLGYGAIWSSGGFNPGLSSRFERLLSATDHVVVASGIVNTWRASPEEIARAVADLEVRYPGRFMLGIGASHAALIESYSRPYSHVVEYLDALDAQPSPVPKERRMLAALGPKMLELAARRSAGAHPYFVPVEHTERARLLMGEGPLLVPEVTVVLERDPSAARELARSFTAGYLSLPNYAGNLRTLGFDADDVSGGGSDRLVDAVVAWGDTNAVASRVREHHEAGADQVCIQVLSRTEGFPLAEYEELASALTPG